MADLHSYGTRFEAAKRHLKESELSQRNKDFVWKFHEFMNVNGISVARQLKYFDKLRRVGLWLGKDFDKADKKDIERVIGFVQERPLSKSTKIDYNIVIKRFYRWLLGNDETHPDCVAWLKTTLSIRDKPLPNQADLLTIEEAEKLVEVADNPRNKAFVSLLYESGCRIGELANLQICNVMFDQYGCVINVNGKTGSRRIRVVNSTSHITRWLDMRPLKKNRNQPLWINMEGKNQYQQMGYNMIRVMLKGLFEKAGINKKCNPHIFRHSRATFLANHMTEAQLKAFFGWVQRSDMASTYVHLSGRDTDKTILELNGLTNKKEQDSTLRPKKCPRCGMINNHSSNYCNRCSGVLDMETAMELQDKLLNKDQQHNKLGNIMELLMTDPDFKEIMFKKILEMNLGKNVRSL